MARKPTSASQPIQSKPGMSEGRQAMLDKALGDIIKRYGEGSIMRMGCLLYTSPSPRDRTRSRMPSSA